MIDQQQFDSLVSTKLQTKPMQYHEAALEVKEDLENLGVNCDEEYNFYVEMLSW